MFLPLKSESLGQLIQNHEIFQTNCYLDRIVDRSNILKKHFLVLVKLGSGSYYFKLFLFVAPSLRHKKQWK